MLRMAVASSNLAEVAYDPEAMVLEVRFRGGGIYQYINVPRNVYDGLVSAASVGRFFDVNVKKAGYACREIAG